MEKIFLLSIGSLAVFWDLWKGKIPNLLVLAGICTGWGFQIADKGLYGILFFLGGAVLPVLILGILYYFRMIGAGDIKLFAAIGSFVGMRTVLMCISVSFLAGAVISLIVMIRRGIFKKRLNYFLAYISNFFQTRKWVPYQTGVEKECYIHFSIPILISLIFYTGGIY